MEKHKREKIQAKLEIQWLRNEHRFHLMLALFCEKWKAILFKSEEASRKAGGLERNQQRGNKTTGHYDKGQTVVMDLPCWEFPPAEAQES